MNPDKFEEIVRILGECANYYHNAQYAEILNMVSIFQEKVDAHEFDEIDQGLFHKALGSIYSFASNSAINTQEFTLALKYAGLNVQVCSRINDSDQDYSMVRAYNNRGIVFHEMGQLLEAEKDYVAALDMILNSQDKRTIEFKPIVENHLASISLTRGNESDGIARLEKSIEDKKNAPAFNIWLTTGSSDMLSLNNKAQIAILRGNYSEGISALKKAIRLAEKEGLSAKETGILWCNLGETYHKADQFEQAYICYQKAIKIHELDHPSLEPLGFDYINLGYLFLEKDSDKALPYFKKAWSILKDVAPHSKGALIVLKNIALLRLVKKDYARARAAVRKGIELYEATRPEFALKEAEHENLITLYRDILTIGMYLSLHEQWADEVLEYMERGKARFGREQLSIRQTAISNPEEKLLKFIHVSDEIAQIAGVDGMIISFFVSSWAVFGVYCHNKRLGAFRVDIDPKNLKELVLDFRNDVMVSSRRAGEGDAGKKLSTLLFEKIEVYYDKIRHLFLLPDGPLWYLPFEALPAPEWLSFKPEKHKFFEVSPMCYSPSVSFLYDIGRVHGNQNKNEKINALIVSITHHDAEFSDLSGAENEIKTIEDTLSEKGQCKILRDAHATKEAFLALAPQYSHLHLITHAVSDFEEEDPFVLFTGTDKKESKFYLSEFKQLQLQADLVFLSACNTSMGENSIGEGLMSLARGFLWRGARCVIASLYPVDDEKVPVFIKTFYGQIASGHTTAEALQKTRAIFKQQYGDIRTWATFQAYGDADAWFDKYSLKHIDIKKIYPDDK